MRILQYRVELDDAGYITVVGGSKDLGDTNYGDDSFSIDLTILALCSASGSDKLVDAIDRDSLDSEGQDADFLQHYEEILYGRSKDWILSDFMVSSGGLSLGFYNVNTKKTTFLCFESPYRLLRFQFDVPSRKRDCPTRYIVELSTQPAGADSWVNIANITESVDGEKLCEISMCRSNEESPDTPKYASITEYSCI